jgi:hypothetical protein
VDTGDGPSVLPLQRFCLMEPLFVFSRWSRRHRTDGSGDSYLLWVIVPLQNGRIFLGTGVSFGCARGGEFAGFWFRILLDGLMVWLSFCARFVVVPFCVLFQSCCNIVRQLLCIFRSNLVCKSYYIVQNVCPLLNQVETYVYVEAYSV